MIDLIRWQKKDLDRRTRITNWYTHGKDLLGMDPSMEQMRFYLSELEQYLHQLNQIIPPSNDAYPFIPLEQMRDLCLKKYVQITRTTTNDDQQIDEKQKQVSMELINTEQIYVDELRQIIENYFLKMNDEENLSQYKNLLFSNLPEIYDFHAKSFLNDLQQTKNPISMSHAIANCFIKRKSNFHLYEEYVRNRSRSEHIWEHFCADQPFFLKTQQSLGHRLSLNCFLLKPIQRIAQYQLLLKELIKNTRDVDERTHLEEALQVILTILAYLNDVMHSLQINGYPENFNDLGRLKLRAEFCWISKEKRRGTVYSRIKTSRRDLFLFEKNLILCKRKDETSTTKCLPYQFKEIIGINDILVCTLVRNDPKKLEILLKDWSYIIQFSTTDPIIQDWLETIRTLMLKLYEQRRAEIKRRSVSADHRRRTKTIF